MSFSPMSTSHELPDYATPFATLSRNFRNVSQVVKSKSNAAKSKSVLLVPVHVKASFRITAQLAS